jgi:hypothetical protein
MRVLSHLEEVVIGSCRCALSPAGHLLCHNRCPCISPWQSIRRGHTLASILPLDVLHFAQFAGFAAGVQHQINAAHQGLMLVLMPIPCIETPPYFAAYVPQVPLNAGLLAEDPRPALHSFMRTDIHTHHGTSPSHLLLSAWSFYCLSGLVALPSQSSAAVVGLASETGSSLNGSKFAQYRRRPQQHAGLPSDMVV